MAGSGSVQCWYSRAASWQGPTRGYLTRLPLLLKWFMHIHWYMMICRQWMMMTCAGDARHAT
jgi:hypothetical protein